MTQAQRDQLTTEFEDALAVYEESLGALIFEKDMNELLSKRLLDDLEAELESRRKAFGEVLDSIPVSA